MADGVGKACCGSTGCDSTGEDSIGCDSTGGASTGCDSGSTFSTGFGSIGRVSAGALSTELESTGFGSTGGVAGFAAACWAGRRRPTALGATFLPVAPSATLSKPSSHRQDTEVGELTVDEGAHEWCSGALCLGCLRCFWGFRLVTYRWLSSVTILWHSYFRFEKLL